MTRRVPAMIALAAVLLTVLFWYFLYRPQRAAQATLMAETAQLEQERGDLQSQLTVLREIEANEEEYRSRLVRLRDYIPDRTEQPNTLLALQRAADAAGVELFQTTFNEPELLEGAPATNEDGTALARIPVLLTINGSYFQVTDMLRRIEVDFDRAVKIASVTMDEEPDNGFPELSVTATGHMFAVLDVDQTSGETVEVVAPDGSADAADGTDTTPPAPSDAPSPAPGDQGPATPGGPQSGSSEGIS